jgi:hypothetical protein
MRDIERRLRLLSRITHLKKRQLGGMGMGTEHGVPSGRPHSMLRLCMRVCDQEHAVTHSPVWARENILADGRLRRHFKVTMMVLAPVPWKVCRHDKRRRRCHPIALQR